MRSILAVMVALVLVGVGCAPRAMVLSYATVTNWVDEVREVVITNTVEELVTNVVTVVETNVVYERVVVTVTNYVQVAAVNQGQAPVVADGGVYVAPKKPSELKGLSGPKPYSEGATVNKRRRSR